MTGPSDSTPPRLSNGEQDWIVAQVVAWQATGAVSAAGLRAAAVETSSSRTARALEAIADELERGRSLRDALAGGGAALPAQLVPLLDAVARRPDGWRLLNDYIVDQRRMSTLRRDLRTALTYPLVVLLLTLLVMVLFPSLTIHELRELYRGLDLQMPGSMRATLWIGEWGPTLLGAFLISGAVGGAAIYFGAGPARFRSLLESAPLVGAVGRWLSIAQWARSLRLLVAADVPLGPALRATAGLPDHRTLSESVLRAAGETERGGALSDSLQDDRIWPESMVAAIRWGERQRALADSLGTVAQVCEERARQRTRWIQLVAPPLLFVLVAHCVLFSYVNLIRPMINLLSAFN